MSQQRRLHLPLHLGELILCSVLLSLCVLGDEPNAASFDIDPKGACSDAILATKCGPKNGPPRAPLDRMAWCLREKAEKAVEQRQAPLVSEACLAEVDAWSFKASSKPVAHFPEVLSACSKSIEANCRTGLRVRPSGTSPGSEPAVDATPDAVHASELDLVSCLEDLATPSKSVASFAPAVGYGPGRKQKLPLECDIAMFGLRRWRMARIENIPSVYQACKDDADAICGKGPLSGDRRACLGRHRVNVSLDCREELFKGELATADAPAVLQSSLHRRCNKEIKNVCADVEPVDGQVLECLWNNLQPQIDAQWKETFKRAIMFGSLGGSNKFMKDKEQGRGSGVGGNFLSGLVSSTSNKGFAYVFSRTCADEVKESWRRAQSDYRLNPAVLRECTSDIERFCKEEKKEADRTLTASGRVMHCLKEKFFEVSDGCSMVLKRTVKEMSSDWRADLRLWRACQADAETLCIGVPPLFMHQCLQDHISMLEEPCRIQEFRQAQLAHADLEFNPILLRMCQMPIDRLCSKVSSGPAVIECLEEHKLQIPEVECVEALEDDEQRTSRDWRLRWGIAHTCKPEVQKLCAEQMHLESPGGAVLQCLIEKKDQIQVSECKKEVNVLVEQQSTSLRASAFINNACQGDVVTLCKNIEPGHGKVQDCLFQNLGKVSDGCAKAEFGLEQAMSKSVALNPRLQKACDAELEKFCKSVSDSDGQRIRCMEDHKRDKDVSYGCRREIDRIQRKKNRDFRLSPLLKRHCAEDIKNLCAVEEAQAHANDKTGGVISCLLNKRGQLSSNQCLNAVMRKAAQRAENYLIVPGMRTICDADVKRFCPSVQPGNGRVHKCLARHLEDLQPECQKQEFTNQIMKQERPELNPWLNSACHGVLAQNGLCADKAPETQMDCLFTKQEDISQISARCHIALEAQAKKRGKSIYFNPAMLRYCGQALNQFISSGKCSGVEKVDSLKTPEFQRLDGRGVQCLTDNLNQIGESRCRQATRQAARMQLENPLWSREGMLDACRDVLYEHCKDTNLDALEKDDGTPIPNSGALPTTSDNVVWDVQKQLLVTERAWSCLRELDIAKVAKPCSTELQHINNISGSDIRLHPKLQRICSTEISGVCQGILAGGGRLLACLKVEAQMMPKSFSEACKKAVAPLAVAPDMIRAFNESRHVAPHRYDYNRTWLDKIPMKGMNKVLKEVTKIRQHLPQVEKVEFAGPVSMITALFLSLGCAFFLRKCLDQCTEIKHRLDSYGYTGFPANGGYRGNVIGVSDDHSL